MKKAILITVGVVVVAAGVYVGLNWNTIMTGFMTSSVDNTAQATLLQLEGAPKAARYQVDASTGKKGNESPIELKPGMALKDGDKFISDGEETKLTLGLDKNNNKAIFYASDFILTKLLGQSNKDFLATLEEGKIVFDIAAKGGNNFTLIDTNKNKVEVISDKATYYIQADSMEEILNVYVKDGKIKLTNTKQEKPVVSEITSENGAQVTGDGSIQPVKADAEWVGKIAWQ